jgi:membrane-bound lytic murein transglycosylase B
MAKNLLDRGILLGRRLCDIEGVPGVALLVVLVLLFFQNQIALSEPSSSKALSKEKTVNYRGWDYVVEKLKNDGISESVLKDIYASPRMPRLGTVYFAVKPREPVDIYQRFRSEKYAEMGRVFMQSRELEFVAAYKRFQVNPAVITAIFLVETQLGKVTGNQLVINRLSRLAAVSEPGNILKNYKKLKKEQPEVNLAEVRARAEHLHKIFYPEIKAFFEVIKLKGVAPLDLRGSVAGAFGMPQFLPSNFLRFGVDADGDKRVSLFSDADAIWSTANFLSNFGWKEGITAAEQKRVIWHYNHSEPYVDTVHWLYEALVSG